MPFLGSSSSSLTEELNGNPVFASTPPPQSHSEARRVYHVAIEDDYFIANRPHQVYYSSLHRRINGLSASPTQVSPDPELCTPGGAEVQLSDIFNVHG
ncbi:hypothetical protein NW759_014616 [Fusarium solani]|nr:hypothetical protein NW759_014616 [Fusarium solani]